MTPRMLGLLAATGLCLSLAAPLQAASDIAPDEVMPALERIVSAMDVDDPCAASLDQTFDAAQALLAAVDAVQIELSVHPADVYHRLAQIREIQSACASRGDGAALWKAALDFYRQAVDAQPYDPLRAEEYGVFRYNLAMALAADEQLSPAIDLIAEAVALDVEHGWGDDYELDLRTLRDLQARLPEDDPRREIDVPAWPAQPDVVELRLQAPTDAGGTARISTDKASFVDGALTREKFGGTLRFVDFRDGELWLQQASDFEPDRTAEELSARVGQLIQQLLITAPVTVRGPDGVLRRLDGLDRVSEQLRQDIRELTAAYSLSDEQARVLQQQLSLLDRALAPEVLFAHASARINYQGPFWSEAQLLKGEWREVALEGQSPVVPQATIDYRHLFKFNRRVACHADDPGTGCVELLLIVEPDAEDAARTVDAFIADAAPEIAAQVSNLDIDISIRHVLRVEPETMAPFDMLRVERRVVTASADGQTRDRVIESREHQTMGYDHRRY